jgi:transposase InsO family protein
MREWKRAGPHAPPRRVGRPVHGEERRAQARALIEQELQRQGHTAGEQPLVHALGDRLTRYLIREVLRELKREKRKRTRDGLARRRQSVHVRYRDVLWSMDATHLGRQEDGVAVQAEVVREVASGLTLEISVGPPAQAHEVIEALERARARRGTLPLVIASDNGPAYVSETVGRYLSRHEVLHLKSLPHTPQHNSWSERGMRDFKEESELGKGVVIDDMNHVSRRLEHVHHRIDTQRLRPSRGGKTYLEYDRDLKPWKGSVTRTEILEKAHCRMREEVVNCHGKREKRRAERRAILETLQCFGLIQLNRGGVSDP